METQLAVIIIVAVVAAVVCVFLLNSSKMNSEREARQDQFKCQQAAIEEGRKHERWLEERRALRDEALKPQFTRAEFDALADRITILEKKMTANETQMKLHLDQAKKVMDSAQTAANQATLALGVRRFPPAREG